MSEEKATEEETSEQDKLEDLIDALTKERKKQADVLVEIAKRGELFHSPDGVAYADFTHKGHRETWPVRSGGYRKYLLHCFYDENQSAPNREATANAINVVEAEAVFKGNEYPIAIRIGGHDNKLYLDLCNDSWQAIEIDEDGWRAIDQSPIRFIRTSGMLSLPMPVAAGKTRDCIRALAKYINIEPGADFALLKAWLLAAFRPKGPYPVLALIGHHGSAKSTTLRVFRALIDPNSGDLRAAPRNPDDLYIAAARSHIILLDNISSIPDWLSDALCRIATGMSYTKRMLFTDQDEVLISAMRPQAITSVIEVIENPDLGDRSIILVPPRIDDDARREEEELFKEFKVERPAILAALLFVVAHGLRTLPDITNKKWPRMADFAKWATACEAAHDKPGTFADAYAENRISAITTLLGDNIIGSAVLQMSSLPWSGTLSALLVELPKIAGEQITKTKDWPKSPNKLGAILRKLVVFLREAGIEVEPPAKSDKTRTWYIRTVLRPTSPDTSPAYNPLKINGLGEVGDVLQGMTVDTPSLQPEGGAPCNICKTSPTSPENPKSPDLANNGNGLPSGEVQGDVWAKSGDVGTSPEMICQHCGAPATADSPVLLCAVDGQEYLLHRACQTEWMGETDDLAIPEFLRRPRTG